MNEAAQTAKPVATGHLPPTAVESVAGGLAIGTDIECVLSISHSGRTCMAICFRKLASFVLD